MLRLLIAFSLASVAPARAQVLECLTAQKQLVADNKIEVCLLRGLNPTAVQQCIVQARVLGIDPSIDLPAVRERITADREAATKACGSM